jgi:large conductance mechanosensitive channel
MLKGFKDFILRGNIVELAVAFVIGAAFAKVVQDFVGAIVTPIISALPGSKVNGFGFSLRGGDLKKATFINLSVIINSLIVFVATAAVVYLALVVPMNKINERRNRDVPQAEAEPTDLELLTEIRDLLASNQRTGGPKPS